MKKTIMLLLLAFVGLSAQSQTQMQNCNYTAKSWGEVLYANTVPGANLYRFQFSNTALSYTQVFTNTGSTCPCTAFYALPGAALNTTYTVAVASSTNNGLTWSAYGPDCTLTSPADYTTQVLPSDCGATASNWNQLFSFYPGGDPDTTQYEVRLTAGSYSTSLIKFNENMRFSEFTGIQPSTTYTVDIREKYHGIWQNYGPACVLTSPPAPTTSMQPAYCTYTATSYSQNLFAESSIGTQYTYKLENAGLSYTQTFTKSNTNFQLNQFTGLQNNTTYSVSVSVFYNGTFGPYGNVCQITTPAAPTSSIVNAECGITATSYTSQIFHTEAVTGFQCYFYNFTDGVSTYTLEKCNNNNFILDQLGGLSTGTTFTVTVKVKYNGIYGPFSGACAITTPSTFMQTVNNPYPNPFNEEFNINSKGILTVLDSQGFVVETVQGVGLNTLGRNYRPGIYNILIKEGDEYSSLKIIKQ